ncbi:hypothetical protein AB6A40_007802 [Gnathostoma spinigerum]|uniref:Eyes absent homolog n=1 Tax=Gnathostoma spinigerum TaxID=75299 RepID=A0ABD6EMJ9_9BILA
MPVIPERSVTLSAMSDAAATAAAVASYDSRMIGASPYYNSGYAAPNYGMYSGAPQSYYPVAPPFRGSTSFAFTTAPQAYYGNGYATGGLDYSPYPAAAACYGNRASCYGGTMNPVSAATSTLYGMGALPTDSTTIGQLSPFSTKNDIKKGKSSKKKKFGSGPIGPDEHYRRVFIWEMEDICVLSNFFLRSGDPIRGQRLAQTVNSNIEQLIVSAFGITRNDECDHVNIEDASIDDSIGELGYSPTEGATTGGIVGLSPLIAQPISRNSVDWMRKLATKYQHVKNMYTLYKNNFPGLIERSGIGAEQSELLSFKSAMDPLTQSWTESVGRCLKLIVERPSAGHYANVLISGESVVSTLTKLLVMEQSSTVSAENVYSTMKTGKQAVIERIVTRFGKKCSFVIISSHADTHEIAKKENIPVWKIKNVQDLNLFYLALNHHLLG